MYAVKTLYKSFTYLLKCGLSKLTHICLVSGSTRESYRCVSKVNQKKFMCWVRSGNVTKVSQALAKGMDPNFQDSDIKGK